MLCPKAIRSRYVKSLEMVSLIEFLPKEIKEAERQLGSDDPYVKSLKEQLRAMQENSGKSAEQVYRMQAHDFSK